MTEQHPITPSPELVDKWLKEPENGSPGLTTLYTFSKPRLIQMLTRAAQWGADQELEACLHWASEWCSAHKVHRLLAARRPKRPSLKQQALAALHTLDDPDRSLTHEQVAAIRRALEALPDD